MVAHIQGIHLSTNKRAAHAEG